MAIRKSQLYSSLWSSCDELRGSMDASQYKDYILTLLFMKYVSDKYAGKADPVIEIPQGGGFYGTGIPACIIVIDKENAHVRTGIFMIDASRGFLKDGNKNRLREQDIHRIVDVFNRQVEVPRYSRMVPVSEIVGTANDYNLNIPRYIDSSEPEDLHDLDAHLRGGIPNACRFYDMFRKTDLAGRCAIITSYEPTAASIKGEETGEGKTEKLLKYDIYRQMLADHFNESKDDAAKKVEQFEEEVKKRFIEQPEQMKLLIVVDKLLTGYDAPPATYLYIDKEMHDHGLFQAICRVNRLDGDDKEYGYVIDYKDLFRALEKSIKDYTSEAFEGYDKEDVAGLLTDRVTKAKERLEELRESVKALCEPVEAPKDSAAYIRYFCGKSGDGEELEDNEQKRVALYTTVASLVRAYADIANEMAEAGYTAAGAQEIQGEVAHYEKVRGEIKLASGDYVDMKMFEPAMRHLLDTYIKADESTKLSAFDDMTLVQLIVEQGPYAAERQLPDEIRKDQEAVAETIENNVRRLIIDEMAVNPKYYEKMSELLQALIKERKAQAVHYTEYLERIAQLAKQVQAPETTAQYPGAIRTPALRALYDNLEKDESLAVAVDQAVRDTKKEAWRGNRFKEREIRAAIKVALNGHGDLTDRIFEIVKEQRDY